MSSSKRLALIQLGVLFFVNNWTWYVTDYLEYSLGMLPNELVHEDQVTTSKILQTLDIKHISG